MLFSHIASFFFFGLAATAIASPAPVAQPVDVARRQDSSVESVLDNLQTTLAPILTQISSQSSSGTVSEANTGPLLTQITDAFNSASTSIDALPTSTKRQSPDELANLVAGIVETVVKTLDLLVGDLARIPALAPLLHGVDPALAKLLKGVEGVVADVLGLVVTLLLNVAGLLTALDFDLTLASLGF